MGYHDYVIIYRTLNEKGAHQYHVYDMVNNPREEDLKELLRHTYRSASLEKALEHAIRLRTESGVVDYVKLDLVI